MKRYSLLAVIFSTALLAFAPGCLITRHATNVVRKDEKPRTVQFESAQAKNIFDGKLAQVKSSKNGINNPSVFAVPFLLWYSSTEVVSDNGVYNDQLAICDTNGDDLISFEEATTYSAQVETTVATGEIQSLSSKPDKSFATHQQTEYQQPLETQQPPVANPPPAAHLPPTGKTQPY